MDEVVICLEDQFEFKVRILGVVECVKNIFLDVVEKVKNLLFIFGKELYFDIVQLLSEFDFGGIDSIIVLELVILGEEGDYFDWDDFNVSNIEEYVVEICECFICY